ncbi:MAG: M14 family zinc carboxypeptidase [Bacteroidota bacterium]
MTTRLHLICLGLFFCVFQLTAQGVDEQYHRARVRLEGHTIWELARLGLETDHGEYIPGRHLTNDFSTSELRKLSLAGFDYEILIDDVVDYYQSPERRLNESTGARGGFPCETPTGGGPDVNSYPIPTNFRLGDMAGFYRYEEMIDILDSMRLLYPNLISPRLIVSPSIVTHGGRPIYWMRISDNPDTDESLEPEVLYTALHHAREPNSLSQMIYYMWYLLENYETDPEVRFLVDNTELYFMPCLNPDGYLLNEFNEPDGGGLWRKNIRDNEDGSIGVDLNRNYDYEWGYDDIGSSPNPESAVYRGTEPFSEPETQAVRAFCQNHEFVSALNYHSFGNLLIYPWGWSDSPTPESETFNTLAAIMTLENNYLAGTGTETVGYTVNGVSDDWMYGETGEKPAIYSMTPEVGRGGGGGGFWPIQEDIIPNCQASVWMNLINAHVPHVAGLATADPSQVEITPGAPFLRFSVQRFGRTAGPLTVNLRSLQDDLIQVASEPLNFDLGENQVQMDSFPLTITGTISSGTLLNFVLEIDNGGFVRTDTVSRVFGDYINTEVFVEDFPTLDNWQPDEGWDLTTEDFVSGPTSLTDSPFEDYPNNRFAVITLDEPLSVNAAEEHVLTFWAKWEIEAFYDWAQLQFQVNDGPWIPACGLYTVSGSDVQDPDQPVWEGEQLDWVQEEVNLTSFLSPGDELSLRFFMVSDQFVNPDGFYVDDIKLLERNSNEVSTSTPIGNDRFSLKVMPNPSPGASKLQVRLPDAYQGSISWQLADAGGQIVKTGNLNALAGYASDDLDTSDLAAGIYFLQLETGVHQPLSQRVVVIK